MRIGLVTPAWPGERTANGIATTVRHLHDGLIAAGHEVTILPMEAGLPREAGAQVVPPPPPRRARLDVRLQMRFGRPWLRNRVVADRIAEAAREAVRRHAIDVLVMEETWGWCGLVQRALPIPVAVTLHGPWFLHRALHSDGATHDDRREAWERDGIRACAGVTAPSRDVLRATEAEIGPFARPAAVIANPMPPGAPSDHAALAPEDRRRLLFVGRYDRHKGGDVMLDAFARIVAQGADARLTFVGPDRGGPGLGSLTAHLGALPEAVRRRVEVRGLLGRAEIAAERRRHAITVIASRYENLNYTLLEALAVGSAVVATAVGGPAEVIRDGENGLLVPPGDPEALARACLGLLADPERARALGAAAALTVRETLAPELIGRQMAAFLATLRR